MNVRQKKAFTLVELMIVIGIIGILLLAVAGLTNDQNTKQQRIIRFAELVQDIITSAKQDMIIGRGTLTGSSLENMIPNKNRSILIATGSITSNYTPVGDTLAQIKKDYMQPFLEGDEKYIIENIQTSSGRILTNNTIAKDWEDVNGLTITFGTNGDMSLSPDAVSFMITVEYETFKRYVVGDTVSGIITTYRQPILTTP